MDVTRITTPMPLCGSPLPQLEVPMISTMVSCLTREHRRLDELNMRLAFAATTLAGDPDAIIVNQRAIEVWDEIRCCLWSHLQVEDELVLSWGRAHHAISESVIDALQTEHQTMRELVAALPVRSSEADREPPTLRDRANFAQTLLALARTLDSHVERYEGEVLPSILRALFRK
jgi:hypothetical protein